jgi:MFS family permease
VIEGITTFAFGFVVKARDDLTLFTALCFVIRCIQGFGAACSETAVLIILGREFSENIGTVMGTVETFGGFEWNCRSNPLRVGMMVGPPFGGFLYESGGFSLPFIVMGSTFVLQIAFLYFVLPPSEVGKGGGHNVPWRSILTNPGILATGITVMFSMSALGFIEPTLSLHLSQPPYELSEGQVGLLFLASSAVYAVFAPLMGYASDRIGTKPIIIAGLGTCALGYLLSGPTPIADFLPRTV